MAGRRRNFRRGRSNPRRGRGRTNRRGNMPSIYRPRKKSSRGNPKPRIISASHSLSPMQPISVNTTTETTAQLTYEHVYKHVYASVARTVPETQTDDFTFVLKGVRVSAPAGFAGKLNFYDVATNYAESDVGTYSSRANCGIEYPTAMLDPVSSLSASSTVICAAELDPIAFGDLEFVMELAIQWKNVSAPSMSSVISHARMLNARNKLEYMFERAGLDITTSLADAVSVVSLNSREKDKKNTMSKLMRSMRGKGSLNVSGGVEYEM